MRGKKFDRETTQKVIDLCDSGMALKDIPSELPHLKISYYIIRQMVNGHYYDDMKSENYKKYQGTSQETQFTNRQARRIRDLHHKKGLWLHEICERYPHVTHGTIRQILVGDTYKDAGGTIGLRDKPIELNKTIFKIPKSERPKIRARWENRENVPVTNQELADEYGVDIGYISRIVNGKQ